MSSNNSVKHLPFNSKYFNSLRDESVPSITKEQLPLEEDAFLLHHFLSPEQCQWLIEATEKMGYNESVHWEQRPPFRRNTRIRITSSENEEQEEQGSFIEWLWQHIRPYVPDTVVLQENHYDTFTRMDLDAGGGYPSGTWHPSAINDVIRCCKYEPGGVFSAHYDGNHVRDDGERSFYTFMIYLNGGFKAGNTNFLVRKQEYGKNIRNHSSSNDSADLPDSATGPEYGIRYRLKPYPGLAVVFRHTLLHEGEPLGSNVKYLLRSDVMYTLDHQDAVSRSQTITRHSAKEEKKREAKRLWKLAEDLERSSQIQKAARVYTRAEALDPEINML